MQRGLSVAEIQPPAGVTPTKLALDGFTSQYNVGPNPIGFWFTYFGKAYDKFYVNVRGFISFAGFYIPYIVEDSPIPSTYEPNNLIAFAASDHSVEYLSETYTANYFLTGTAPNRILVINYKNVPCTNEVKNTFTQIQLYEQGGKIEIHNTQNISLNTPRTIGLENYDGTIAVTEPNLNFSKNINSVNEMIRFAPNCNNQPVISPTSAFICPPAASTTLTGSCGTGNVLWSTGETTSSITANPPVGSNIYQLSCISNGCANATAIYVKKPTNVLSGPTTYCGTYGYGSLGLDSWELFDPTTQFQWKIDGVNYTNNPPPGFEAFFGIKKGGVYTCDIKYGTCTFTSTAVTVTDITPPKMNLSSTTFKLAWDQSYASLWATYSDNPLVIKTPDKGYMIAASNDGGVGNDKSAQGFGEYDYWVIKTDSLGKKIWDKAYGTNIDEFLSSFIATNDGGYVLAGYNRIYSDHLYRTKWYIVKINSNGDKLWEKIYTTNSAYNDLNAIIQTSDGGFLVGGSSIGGATGDKTQASYGDYDYWIMKLDSQGNKLWDKAYGGTLQDKMTGIISTADGGYLLGGYSASDSSGVKTSRKKGFYDFWIVKIDASGNKQWDKAFGGASTAYDNQAILSSFVKTPDGGYLLGGYALALSAGGDKSENNAGMADYWIVKTDANGNKQWDKTFGRKRNDQLAKIAVTNDGGYLLAGTTDTDLIEIEEAEFDYWIVKINNNGNKIWEKRIATVKTETLNTMLLEPDGKLVLLGTTNSGISMDKTSPRKSQADIWMVKVSEIISDNIINLKPYERFSTELVVNDCPRYITWNGSYNYTNKLLVNSLNNQDYASYAVYCGTYGGCPMTTMYVSFNRCGSAVSIIASDMATQKPEILRMKATQTLTAEKRILTGDVIFNAGKAIYLNPGFSVAPSNNYFKAEIIDVPCP